MLLVSVYFLIVRHTFHSCHPGGSRSRNVQDELSTDTELASLLLKREKFCMSSCQEALGLWVSKEGRLAAQKTDMCTEVEKCVTGPPLFPLLRVDESVTASARHCSLLCF